MEDNNVIIGGKNYEIKPIKLKYMKGFYHSFLALKEHGLMNLLAYSNGEEMLLIFLRAVFDMPEVDEGLLKGLYKELINNSYEKTIQRMLEVTKRLNLIMDEREENNNGKN
jgi:hypothetical protein